MYYVHFEMWRCTIQKYFRLEGKLCTQYCTHIVYNIHYMYILTLRTLDLGKKDVHCTYSMYFSPDWGDLLCVL